MPSGVKWLHFRRLTLAQLVRIMHRIGARPWMYQIMVTWGLASAATLFAANKRSFYVLRLLLGAAEAGFFPGAILYLSYWFPNPGTR